MKKVEEFNVNEELNKEIELENNEQTSSGTFATAKKILRTVFMPSTGSENKLENADDAYLRATHTEYVSRRKMFQHLVQRVKESIHSRVAQHAKFCIVDIDPEMIMYIGEIKSALQEYGYSVWTLGKNELEQLEPNNKVNRTTMIMLIMWDKVYE